MKNRKKIRERGLKVSKWRKIQRKVEKNYGKRGLVKEREREKLKCFNKKCSKRKAIIKKRFTRVKKRKQNKLYEIARKNKEDLKKQNKMKKNKIKIQTEKK